MVKNERHVKFQSFLLAIFTDFLSLYTFVGYMPEIATSYTAYSVEKEIG